MVALSLATLLLTASFPLVDHVQVGFYCLLAFAGGFVLIALNWVLRGVSAMKMEDKKVYCSKCGWYGTGRDLFRFECCPECENEKQLHVI